MERMILRGEEGGGRSKARMEIEGLIGNRGGRDRNFSSAGGQKNQGICSLDDFLG